MIKEIIKFTENANISYIILFILLLIVLLLFLRKKNTNFLVKESCIIIYTSLAWIIFYFTNDILNEIFRLQFLSIKLYLVVLIISNIIMLITINKNINKTYKIINTMLFLSDIIILVLSIITIIGNKSSYFLTITLNDCVKLININFIIFIIYLITLCITYIIKEIVNTIQSKQRLNKYTIEKPNIKEVIEDKSTKLTIPQNLQNNQEEGFFIDGVNCSIIFEDPNKENIVKNYNILLNDINAKLTNGYTLKENIKIKDIFNKLSIKDINTATINVNKLSKMTEDEYNLLKKYLSKENN